MSCVRPCSPKTHSELALEWDQLAEERHRQITSGKDLSFDHVLAPTILRLLEGADTTLILDVGSGTGELTKRLAKKATKVIGVEASAGSVSIARATCAEALNVEFVESPLEHSVSSFRRLRPTAAVAAMTLMTAPNLAGFAKSLSKTLANGARFVATVLHPCFWPIYWEYDKEPWFKYSKETFVVAPFVISQWRTETTTTHIHRPLEMYISAFASAGFTLDSILEPVPSAEVQALYPRPWRFPRFIGFRWTREASKRDATPK